MLGFQLSRGPLRPRRQPTETAGEPHKLVARLAGRIRSCSRRLGHQAGSGELGVWAVPVPAAGGRAVVQGPPGPAQRPGRLNPTPGPGWPAPWTSLGSTPGRTSRGPALASTRPPVTPKQGQPAARTGSRPAPAGRQASLRLRTSGRRTSSSLDCPQVQEEGDALPALCGRILGDDLGGWSHFADRFGEEARGRQRLDVRV